MINRLTFNEKFKLVLNSSKDYRGILLIGMLFISVGAFLMYLGFRYEVLFLIIFGGIFVSVALFFLLFTIPSSVSYSYDKALTKKYGKIKNAILKEKDILDNSYFERKRRKLTSELNYQLTFSFEYQNKVFENSDFVEKIQFDKLNIGDSIPIKFLSVDPNKSSIRKTTLKRQTN